MQTERQQMQTERQQEHCCHRARSVYGLGFRQNRQPKCFDKLKRLQTQTLTNTRMRAYKHKNEDTRLEIQA